jgi:hypothetical protein
MLGMRRTQEESLLNQTVALEQSVERGSQGGDRRCAAARHLSSKISFRFAIKMILRSTASPLKTEAPDRIPPIASSHVLLGLSPRRASQELCWQYLFPVVLPTISQLGSIRENMGEGGATSYSSERAEKKHDAMALHPKPSRRIHQDVPAMNGRSRNLFANLFLQSGSDLRNNQNTADTSFGYPWFEKLHFFIPTQQLSTPSAPGSFRLDCPGSLIAKLSLHSDHGGDADAKQLTDIGIGYRIALGGQDTQRNSLFPRGVSLCNKMLGCCFHFVVDLCRSRHDAPARLNLLAGVGAEAKYKIRSS